MSLALSGADVGHLAVAAGLTYALGFERALRSAAAGDRVFALIGTGSGVVGIIALHGAPNVAAGAITGIGFIGGGMVFRQAVGRTHVVVGLNTAAAIFAAAAIGLAAGQRRLLVAAAGTAAGPPGARDQANPGAEHAGQPPLVGPVQRRRAAARHETRGTWQPGSVPGSVTLAAIWLTPAT